MRDIVLTDMERLGAFADAEQTFQMTEETFRLFYDRTARPVWLYLARMTRDDRLADDLLQEAYYRFLRATVTFDDDEHRKNYLFRIATNLVRDHRRRTRISDAAAGIGARHTHDVARGDPGDQAARRIDLARALGQLKPRERSVLWLAYAQGWSHEEIAASVGVKAASMKALLHRARKRLAALLRPSHGAGGSL
jgi:RNA polymerase sigma-70 factor (ECF subfamily)